MAREEITDGVRLRWESDHRATVWNGTDEDWGVIRYTEGVARPYLVTTPVHESEHAFADTASAVAWLRGYDAGFRDAEDLHS
ncbi:hypothetical protein [Streptomyces sp. NPDC050485]|uniref:hypothetical protein n=1 Tax=Streptomyces sp. NPDC050485 TaxID=3365617 RepID=UPI00378973C1